MTELIFDMGQTGTRVQIRDVDSTLEVSLPAFKYGDDLGRAIATTVEAAAHDTGNAHVDVVSGGCTGLYGVVPDLSSLAHTLHSSVGANRIIIADDAVTSYFGALREQNGVMAAVGTGLVAFGVGESASARVDGMGVMAGDNGAGWWVGRQGIIAAFSANDGRAGGSAALLDSLVALHGPIESVAKLIATSESPIATVASFARTVAELAHAGDTVATRIWHEAAVHIGESIVAAARRSAQSEAFPFVITGGLAQASTLIDAVIADTVHAHFPDAHRIASMGNSLDGAHELLNLPTVSRLSPFVGEYTHS